MAKLSNPFLKRIIKILPVERSFFVNVTIPKVRLNKEIILLNYGRLSPFANSDVVFFKKNNRLYLWFFERNSFSQNFVVPEGYLIFKAYAEPEGDKILLLRIDNENYLVTVIKKDNLEAQFRKNNISSSFLEALKRKYGISDAEIVDLERDKMRYNLAFSDAAAFLSFRSSLDFKKIIGGFFESVKIPVIILLLIINVANWLMYSYVSKIIVSKRAQLLLLEEKNKNIKEQYAFLEKESVFFKKFYSKELSYPSLYSVLLEVTKIVGENNGSINSYRQSYNIINIIIVSSSTAQIVSDFIESGMFKSAKILSVSQSPVDKAKEVGNIELTLRKISRNKHG